MNEDYEFQLTMLKGTVELDKLDQESYNRIFEMLMDSDGEDLDRLLIINQEFINAMEDHRKQKICSRLVIGAEKIEATTDQKERSRLMVHYNNLLKELGA